MPRPPGLAPTLGWVAALRDAQAVICGLALCILTMLIEVTLFVIGATRVDTKTHRRAQAAAQGTGSDLTRLQEHYGKASRSGPREH